MTETESLFEDIPDDEIAEVINTPSKFVETVIGVEPYDYQKEVLDNENDRKAFVSGRQVGKSRTAAWMALHHALTHSNHEILITAPTQRQSSNLFKQIKTEMAESVIPSELWGTERETRTVLEFENGTNLYCLPTGDSGSTIRGYTADYLVVDEAAFIEDEVFEQALMPMLATTDGSMTLLSTPMGDRGFLFNAFNDRLADDYYTKQVPSYRSPLVGDDFVSNQQKQLSNTAFKQEILGKFVENQNSFFPDELVENTVTKNPDMDTSRIFLGVDLARHGDDRSVYTVMDSDFNVVSVDYANDESLTESIGRVKTLNNSYKFDKIAVDSTGLGGGVVDILKDDLNRTDVEGIKFTISSKEDLYNTLREHMEAGEVTFPSHDMMERELMDMEREFTQQGRQKIFHPEGGTDDFADALCLATYACDTGNVTRQSGMITL